LIYKQNLIPRKLHISMAYIQVMSEQHFLLHAQFYG
jgi:hypothetical protein